jgi:hypothetical protein
MMLRMSNTSSECVEQDSSTSVHMLIAGHELQSIDELWEALCVCVCVCVCVGLCWC